MSGRDPIVVQLPVPRCTAAEAARLIDECSAELRRAEAAITVPTSIKQDLLQERDTELEEARFNASFSWDETLERYTLACGCRWVLESQCDGYATWKEGRYVHECEEHGS